MPIYVYECKKCQNRFELLVGVTSGDGDRHCPKCGSDEIHKRPATFGVSVTSSSSCTTGSCSTGTCPTCY